MLAAVRGRDGVGPAGGAGMALLRLFYPRNPDPISVFAKGPTVLVFVLFGVDSFVFETVPVITVIGVPGIQSRVLR